MVQLGDGTLRFSYKHGIIEYAEIILDRAAHPYEFLYKSSAENLIFMNVPLTGRAEVPAPDKILQPGQKFIEMGFLKEKADSILWVEISYIHNTTEYRQRFYYLPFRGPGIKPDTILMLRAEAQISSRDVVFKASERIPESSQSF